MSSKIKAGISILLLVGLIALLHKTNVLLEERIINKNDLKETFKYMNTSSVIIDPGHGGIDDGKIGVNGEKEKDINLNISLKIKKILEENDIEVVMTREEDGRLADSQTEDLKARVDVMNRVRPVLAVSIHQNSYHDAEISGAQVFYHSSSEEGRRAAEKIRDGIRSADPAQDRENKANDSYYILKYSEVPAVIVECGFLSNPAEAERLVDGEYQEKIAGAVAAGILQYIND